MSVDNQTISSNQLFSQNSFDGLTNCLEQNSTLAAMSRYKENDSCLKINDLAIGTIANTPVPTMVDDFKNRKSLEEQKSLKNVIFHYSNGDIYQGSVLGELFHGEGTYTAKNGKFIYRGQFSYGAKHGAGEETLTEKYFYKGSFANNYFHGQGNLNFTTGESFIGSFCNGCFHGKGFLRFPEFAIDCQFEHNAHIGSWTCCWNDGWVYTGFVVQNQSVSFNQPHN